jgi:hypothetical protein
MSVFLCTHWSGGTVNEEEPCIARASESEGRWSGGCTSEVPLTAKRTTPEVAAARMSAEATATMRGWGLVHGPSPTVNGDRRCRDLRSLVRMMLSLIFFLQKQHKMKNSKR